ncbi:MULTISPECIES: SRPBCC family protein [Actinomadura]|uniref:SRPBCC family protein n=1 Tax=Actinomadura yumaensis TaxID=111807 RepID=A0ABW2CX67_9ACTN|nr:SRPBCC family protein [Actinomadura sp. J1-007]MWK36315.1 cyclase [Actinomadura sp. J1-007]
MKTPITKKSIGKVAQRIPTDKVARRIPIGGRKRTPVVGRITKNLPVDKIPTGGLSGARAAGAAGGVLLGAGAAVAATKVAGRLNGRGDGGDSSDSGATKRVEKPGEDEERDTKAARNAKTGQNAKSGGNGKADQDTGGDGDGGGDGEKPGVLGRLAEKAKGTGGGKGGGAEKVKVTNIVEHVDIGAPRRLVYDQWTQFQDFPSFMKKVVSIDQPSEEKLDWKVKIFWSSRTWESTIVEQVPDSHIVWRSKGAKGHVDGTVSFHSLAPNLTRVLMVLEYHPQGLFERIGNMWRAQGRRARLELKHFRRYVMTHSLTRADEIEGWRGEIRDSEVVTTHEDAVAEEGKNGSSKKTEDKPASASRSGSTGRSGSGSKSDGSSGQAKKDEKEPAKSR